MSLSAYLRATLVLMMLDAIVLGFLYSIQIATGATPVFLAARALLDVVFIGTNLHRIGLKLRDGMMIFWLIGAGVAGIILALSGEQEYSIRRGANDVLLPVLFILKVALIIRVLPHQGSLATDVRTLVRWLAIGSVVQIAIFLTIGRQFGAYAGISVPATLPIADAMARGAVAMGLLMVALVLASGKRAVLLSVLAAFTALVLGARRRFLVLLSALAVFLIAALSAPLFEDTIAKFEATLSASEDIGIVLERGPGAVLDDDVRAGFYLATAGRSEEFYGLVAAMEPLNYLIGMGAGFTYDYAHTGGTVRGYANSHFSPLSLTYKFGVVFCLMFYLYVFRHSFWLVRRKDALPRVVGYALLMLAVQSLFSFNLFAEPLLPILAAIAAFFRGERYGPTSGVEMAGGGALLSSGSVRTG